MTVEKVQVNTRITKEAHRALMSLTTPRSIGTFLSDLILEHDRHGDLTTRFRQIEEEMEDIRGRLLIKEAKKRVKRAKADPAGETIPFEVVMQEMGINVDYQP